MRQFIFYITFCFLAIGCSTTKEISNDISTFQLKKININKVEKIETENNGVEKLSNVPTSQGYFPELNIYKFSQPKFYNRKNDSLTTAVSYFYTEKNNVVRVISYAWNEQDGNESPQAVFDKNKKLFTSFFKNNGEAKRVEKPTYWQDELRWENKKVLVFQFILGNQKGAYRTRTIIKYK
jgi:hypothetical protein